MKLHIKVPQVCSLCYNFQKIKKMFFKNTTNVTNAFCPSEIRQQSQSNPEQNQTVTKTLDLTHVNACTAVLTPVDIGQCLVFICSFNAALIHYG